MKQSAGIYSLETRRQSFGGTMQTLWQDLRYGVRMLRTQKSVTIIAALSLALGIGANTALFSLVDAMLLKMLFVKDPERLLLLKTIIPQGFSIISYTVSPDS